MFSHSVTLNGKDKQNLSLQEELNTYGILKSSYGILKPSIITISEGKEYMNENNTCTIRGSIKTYEEFYHSYFT